MMPAVRRALVLAIAALVVVPGAAHAATVTLAKVGDFATPVYVTAPLGDTTRVFVVEKGGTIQVLDGAVRSTFLDITSKVQSTENERGLLSMAFAPDYLTSGLFYVYYTAKSPAGQLTIEEYRVDPANRRPGGCVVRAPARHDPARPAGQPQRRPVAVRPRRLPLRGHRRRRQRRRSQRQRADDDAGPAVGRGVGQPRLPPRQAPAHRPRHGRRLDLRLRPAQPVALLLRPQHRRPRHRRRRPGPLRGGRLRRGAGRRRGRQLRLEHVRGAAHLPGRGPGRRRAGDRPARHRVPARPGVLDHRRLRGARPRPAGARGHLPVRRQLHGDHLGRHAAGRRAAHARLHGGERVELRRGRLRARLRRVAGRRRLPLREQRRVRRAGALRRPAARRRGRGPARRRPRSTRAGADPAARRGAPARAAHRLRHHPRPLRRAVHRDAPAGACSSRVARGRRRRRRCARAPPRRRWPRARARPCA